MPSARWSALAAAGDVVLRPLAHAPDLPDEVVEVVRALHEVDVGRVHDEERGLRVEEEEVVVRAVDLGEVLLGEPALLRAPARADPLHEDLGGSLEVDHEVGPGHALREQRVELLVDEKLAVLEVQVGEHLALVEDVVGDRGLREEAALRELLLLAVAREQEEELDLEGGPRLGVVERLQERVLPPLLEHGGGVETLGETLHHRGLPHPDGAFDRDVVEGHQPRTSAGVNGPTSEASGQRARSSATVAPSSGWRKAGAISARGTSTNRRSCSRGWGRRSRSLRLRSSP